MVDDDFALEPVPDDRTVSGFRIAVVLTGIVVGLPSFIIAATLGSSLGFHRGSLAILFGGVILSVIALATGIVGAKTRLTTAMIVRQTFGSLGSRIVSGILAIACLGWFGVTANMFGQSLHQILADLGWDYLPPSTLIAIGGLLMTVTTIFGFAGLQRLSGFTVPMLALLIGYTAFIAMQKVQPAVIFAAEGGDTSLTDGISAIVGSLSVAVTIFPDLCRFSRRPRDAVSAGLLTYAVAMPAVFMLAMIPSIAMQNQNVIAIMTALGLGIPALALLVVKAWATNSGNLYVAALSGANFLSSTRQKYIVVGAGVLGTLSAAMGIADSLVPFLIALGISIPPIAGIYVADFWIGRPGYDHSRNPGKMPAKMNVMAFGCWGFGIAVALAARSALLTLSGVSTIDSMLAAAGSYLVCRWAASLLQNMPSRAGAEAAGEAAALRN